MALCLVVRLKTRSAGASGGERGGGGEASTTLTARCCSGDDTLDELGKWLAMSRDGTGGFHVVLPFNFFREPLIEYRFLWDQPY